MAGVDITARPRKPEPVRFREGFGQRFLVTIDTEEEFDWGSPLDRSRHSLDSVPALRKFQQFCEGFSVVPLYLVDYPVATHGPAREVLKDAVVAGRAEIGVHLHPWVNPPFSEDIDEFNSFAGNLPVHLEREKFQRLRDEIEKAFDVAPLIYRAGRYGAGPNTAEILSEGGLAIDTSVRATFDYSATGGPNFRDHPLFPYWIDLEKGLLELPVTTVFWGLLRRQAPWLFPRMWRVPRMRGIMSRLGLMERIPLTPEGIAIDEAMRGIDIAIDDGLPVLVFSFHSPSIAPGHTPYVRTEEDLDAFYDWWRSIFTYLEQRKVEPASIREIMSAVELA